MYPMHELDNHKKEKENIRKMRVTLDISKAHLQRKIMRYLLNGTASEKRTYWES